MNNKLVFYFGLAVLFAVSCKPKGDGVLVKQLQKQLAQKNYFKLAALYRQAGNQLADSDRLWYKAFIDNAFNRNADCIKDVDTLLNVNNKQTDTVLYQLKRLQEDSYFKTFQYAKAAQCDSDILKNCKKLHKTTLDDVSNDFIIRNGLRNTPAQQTEIKSNTSIQWKKDAIGLIEIPFSTNGQTFSAIWDTRANISSISRTYAQKLGLHMLNINYNESSGLTGITFKTDMGIADSLTIGGIKMKNVIFQVMPDSILYLAQIKFRMDIIIGFPVISQWQEIHVFQNGQMTIPAKPSAGRQPNFALDGLDPVIALACGKDTIPFYFDSGASNTVFYLNYLNRYKKDILKTAKEKTVGFGGAGGMQMRKAYVLPKVTLGLNGKNVVIDSVTVRKEKIIPGEVYYGNIGQDFVRQFSELIYNFRDMYVDGVKNR